MKISDQELNNIKFRKVLLENKNLEIQLLNNEYRNYISAILKQHGCEDNKEFEINLTDGTISPKKMEEKKL